MLCMKVMLRLRLSMYKNDDKGPEKRGSALNRKTRPLELTLERGRLTRSHALLYLFLCLSCIAFVLLYCCALAAFFLSSASSSATICCPSVEVNVSLTSLTTWTLYAQMAPTAAASPMPSAAFLRCRR